MRFVAEFNAFLRDEVNLNQTRLDRLQASVYAIETFLACHPTVADSFLDLIPTGSWAQRAIIWPEQAERSYTLSHDTVGESLSAALAGLWLGQAPNANGATRYY